MTFFPHTQPQPIARRYHHEITCTKTIEKRVVLATTALGTCEIQRQMSHCKLCRLGENRHADTLPHRLTIADQQRVLVL